MGWAGLAGITFRFVDLRRTSAEKVNALDKQERAAIISRFHRTGKRSVIQNDFGRSMTIRICFIGDSITLGTGDAAMLGWPGRLGAIAWSQGHQVTVYNLGVRGETSEDELRARGFRVLVLWECEIEGARSKLRRFLNT